MTTETSNILSDQNKFLELRPGLFRSTFILSFGPIALPIATFLIRGNPIPNSNTSASTDDDGKNKNDNQAYEWIMIDAGAPPHASEILCAIETVLSHPQDTLKYICITHAHFDHTGATLLILERYKECKVVGHYLEKPFLCEGKELKSCAGDTWVFNVMKYFLLDSKVQIPEEKVVFVREGEAWEYGELIKVVETHGHTPGSISFIHVPSRSIMIGDASKNHAFFSKQSCLSYPLSSTYQMGTAIRSMDKIISLKGQVDTIFPGHDFSKEGIAVAEMMAFRAENPRS
ncbi:MAG: beta-lactamase-like protein [Linnemannia gamsii]|nr:MAG: beta-lactamase-like protein [Linnemannia gamsii]